MTNKLVSELPSSTQSSVNRFILNDPKADRLFALLLEKIKQEILNILGRKVWFIVVAGGFGRGEGIAFVDENERLIIPNDIDLQLIIRSHRNRNELLKKLQTRLYEFQENFNIKWIDIQLNTPAQLHSMWFKSQYGYDLLHGSKVIYGHPKRFYSLLGDFTTIHPKWAELLMFARQWCFLGPYEKKNLAENDLTFFFDQLAKAIIAAVEAYLIITDRYETSYFRKLELAQQLEYFQNYNHLITWAFSRKLALPHETIPIEALYRESLELFLSVFRDVIKFIYQRTDWEVYFEFYNPRVPSYPPFLSRLKSELSLLLKRQKRKRDIEVSISDKIFLGEFYLLSAFLDQEMNHCSVVNRLIGTTKDDWFELKNELLELHKEHIH